MTRDKLHMPWRSKGRSFCSGLQERKKTDDTRRKRTVRNADVKFDIMVLFYIMVLF